MEPEEVQNSMNVQGAKNFTEQESIKDFDKEEGMSQTGQSELVQGSEVAEEPDKEEIQAEDSIQPQFAAMNEQKNNMEPSLDMSKESQDEATQNETAKGICDEPEEEKEKACEETVAGQEVVEPAQDPVPECQPENKELEENKSEAGDIAAVAAAATAVTAG